MHGGEAGFFRAGAARSKAPCCVGAREISEGFFGEPARIAPEIRYTGQRR